MFYAVMFWPRNIYGCSNEDVYW